MISDSETAELQEIFNLIDTDQGGTISCDELGRLFHILGVDASEDEITSLIDEMDEDKSGEIGFDEFLKVMSKKITGNFTSDDVLTAFKSFSKPNDPDGLIDIKALKQAITRYGDKKFTEDELQFIFDRFQVHRGRFNYKEFVLTMMVPVSATAAPHAAVKASEPDVIGTPHESDTE